MNNRIYVVTLCAAALVGSVPGCSDEPGGYNAGDGTAATGGGTGATGGGTGATGGGTAATGGGTAATGGGTAATGGGDGDGGGMDDVGLCAGLDYLPGEADDGSCIVGGWFAVKATYDVWWDEDDTSTSSDNRGTYTTHILQHVDGHDPAAKTVTVTNKVCKEEAPPSLSDLLCKAFSTVVPEPTWDKIPAVVTGGGYTCLDKDSNCVVSANLETSLVGIEMNDKAGPWGASWDAMSCPAGNGAVCFEDIDGDSKPGITAGFRTTGQYTEHTPCSNGNPHDYSNAPPDGSIGAILNVTVSEVHAGTRARMGVASRTIGSSCGCGTSEGVVELKDTRVVGCRAIGFGTERECTVDEVTFIDSRSNKHINEGADQGMHIGTKGQVPEDRLLLDSHHASPGPVFRSIRIANEGDAAPTCAQVLGSTFPEPDIIL